MEIGRTRYALDPHAHLDLMHTPSKNEWVIASAETKELAKARGYDLGPTT